MFIHPIFYSRLSRLVDTLRRYKGPKKGRQAKRLYPEIVQLFEKNARIEINFTRSNPLSDMETITLALRACGHDLSSIGLLLKTTHSTVQTYEERARRKLNACSMHEALYIAALQNYLTISKKEEDACPYCEQQLASQIISEEVCA